MAWTILWALVVIFSLMTVGVFCLLFFSQAEYILKGGLTLIDGVVGWSIKHIVSFLFPLVSQGEVEGLVGNPEIQVKS